LWARFEGDAPDLAALRAWAPTYRSAVWNGALAEFDVNDRALGDYLAERFPVERRAIHRPYPDVGPTLRALRDDGRFRLGLLTNGLSCLQREKLRRAELDPWFDAVVAGGDIGCRKPDTAMFDEVLARLGTARPDAWMIGNNPETDIRGARGADIEAILIVRGGLPPRDFPPGLDGVPVITDLRQLAARLGVTISGRECSRRPRT
jgi:putative hydrolase of the HAD superfamily